MNSAELDQLLTTAAAAADPAGGFGWLDEHGARTPGKVPETWIGARMTHVFALAAAWGRPGAAELAEHGRRALTGLLRDDAHGGWWPDALGGEQGPSRPTCTPSSCWPGRR